MDYSIELEQVYQLGRHRLMCGDATKAEDIEKLLGEDERADLVITDPPYGINVMQNGKIGGRVRLSDVPEEERRKRITETFDLYARKNWDYGGREWGQIIGDNTTDAAREHYKLALGFSDNQIVFGGNYFSELLPPSKGWIVWDKQNGRNNFSDGELLWTSFDSILRIYEWRWSGMVRKGARNEELISRIHPTQKPVGLLRAIMEDYSDEGDLILDCFLGSGSTLIAAESCGRRCYGMELSPDYCKKILQRYEDYTGDKPVLIL